MATYYEVIVDVGGSGVKWAVVEKDDKKPLAPALVAAWGRFSTDKYELGKCENPLIAIAKDICGSEKFKTAKINPKKVKGFFGDSPGKQNSDLFHNQSGNWKPFKISASLEELKSIFTNGLQVDFRDDAEMSARGLLALNGLDGNFVHRINAPDFNDKQHADYIIKHPNYVSFDLGTGVVRAEVVRDNESGEITDVKSTYGLHETLTLPSLVSHLHPYYEQVWIDGFLQRNGLFHPTASHFSNEVVAGNKFTAVTLAVVYREACANGNAREANKELQTLANRIGIDKRLLLNPGPETIQYHERIAKVIGEIIAEEGINQKVQFPLVHRLKQVQSYMVAKELQTAAGNFNSWESNFIAGPNALSLYKAGYFDTYADQNFGPNALGLYPYSQGFWQVYTGLNPETHRFQNPQEVGLLRAPSVVKRARSSTLCLFEPFYRKPEEKEKKPETVSNAMIGQLVARGVNVKSLAA